MHNISNSSSKAEQSLIDVMQSDANESEQSSIADNTSDTVREDQTFGQGELKDVNEYLKGKVGADINAKKWLEGCEGLDDVEKSEVIIRLVYEVCLAKNIEYDLENDAAEDEKGSKRDRNFDAQRIFELLKEVNRLLLPQDHRNLVELICRIGNVKLLELTCRQEVKKNGIYTDEQFSWKGEFTGYKRPIELLQYVLKQRCSSEIALCIAKKLYGTHHNVLSGREYLENSTIQSMKKRIGQPNSVMEECLKTAIKLGYKNVVLVMLGGDVYHCIRLMKKFQGRFSEALDMVEETVAEVMSSGVQDESGKQDLLKEVKGLLKKGIEIDIEKMSKKNLINELEGRGMDLSGNDKKNVKILVEKLRGEVGGDKMGQRLSKTVVGSLVSTLFFNYQKELMKKPFELKIVQQDRCSREDEINELNKKINDKSFVKEKVLEKIKSLNSSSHMANNRFFREVLAAIVNDEERFNKLKAVCAAICKEPVEELLKDVKVYEDVIDALKFFDVEHNQTSTPKKGHSEVGVTSHFTGNIGNLVKWIRELNHPSSMADEILEIAKGLASSKVPAFSGLTRRTIIKLKNKRDRTSDEAKDLKEKVLKMMDEIKEGINTLADNRGSIYIKDIFRHFEIINSEIEDENKRKIVELVCRSSNVRLLEMICRQEVKEYNTDIHRQYLWKGEFTGYKRPIELLQYVLKQRCSSEIALCIAEKLYGTHHNVLSGREYLENSTIQSMEKRIGQPNSVMEECLKTAIKLGYKNVVLVMLGGDVYHCIRLMEKFQGRFSEALDMVEETVAEVMSSWVNGERQSFKDDVQCLLKEGVEVEISEMRKNEVKKKDLIVALKFQGIKLSDKDKRSKVEKLREKLKGEEIRLRLSKTVVGGLISTLFFDYQIKKPFELKYSKQDNNERKEEINELNKKINDKSFVKEKVLEKIKSLNSSSHMSNNRFFREVLAAIVNDEGRFNKLQAVCAAICKEPMQKLLRGAEVHEDVVDALKFFGVDPLVLEKSMTIVPENSNVVLNRNIPSLQVEDLTLNSNSGSEKSTSLQITSDIASSSRQPSPETSRDLQEIRVTEPVEVKAKVLSSVSPGSKAVEEKNKSFMQTSCGQGEKPCYSVSTSGHLGTQNGFKGVVMPKLGNEKKDWDSVLRGSFKRKSRNLIDVKLPKVNELEDYHHKRHKEELLFKIFDHNRLIDDPVFSREGSDGDSSKELSDLSLNTSSDASLDTSGSSADQQFQDECDKAVRLYKEGVKRLKQGGGKEGESMITNSALMGFPYAMYAYAIIKFGKIWRSYNTGDVQRAGSSEQEIIENAVKCMINSKDYFFPLNNFVLGMIKLYDIGGYKELIKDESTHSWQGYFASVLLATEGTPLMDEIKKSKILSEIQCGNFGFVKPDKYMRTVGDEKGMEDLKWMVQCIEYELVRELTSSPKSVSVVGSMLKKLSLDGFTDARYLYAFALLNCVFGELEYDDADKVYDLLCSSIDAGHQEAKLLFATLPFRTEFKFLKGNRIEDGKKCFKHLKDFVYEDNPNVYFKEVSALLIAREYLNKNSCYVLYDEEKAKGILGDAGCIDVLKELGRKLEKQQEGSKNVLIDVLKILKKVKKLFKESNDSKLGRLVFAVEVLFKELQTSKISIQQSDSLSHILKLLDSASSIGKGSLLSLRQLCAALEEEVEKQSHISLQKEILQLLRNLDKVCSTLQEEHSNSSSSSIGTTSDSTVQLLHTEPVKDKSKSVSDAFVHSQLSAPQGCSTPLSSGCEGMKSPGFLFGTASSSTGQPLHTETVESGKSIFENIKCIQKRVENCTIEEVEAVGYNKDVSNHIVEAMNAMHDLMVNFGKNDELKKLLEQETSKESKLLVYLFNRLSLFFKKGDPIVYADLVRAVNPLKGIKDCIVKLRFSKGLETRLSNTVSKCNNIESFLKTSFASNSSAFDDVDPSMISLIGSEEFSCSKQMIEEIDNAGAGGINATGDDFSTAITAWSDKNKDILKPNIEMFVFIVEPYDNSELADNLNYAARLCRKHDYKQVLEVYRGTKTRQSLVGCKVHDYCRVFYNEAAVLFKMGEYGEVSGILCGILKDVHGGIALSIVRNMAAVLCIEGRYNDAVEVLRSTLKKEKLKPDHYYALLINNDIKMILKRINERSNQEGASSHLLGSMVDEDDENSYASSFNTSDFTSSVASSDRQNISKEDKIANLSHRSNTSGRTKQEQNLYSSQQNVSGTRKKFNKGISIKRGKSISSKRVNFADLCKVVEEGRIMTLERFIGDGADIFGNDKDGNTLLHVAAKGASDGMMNYLIRQGLKLDSCNTEGNIPLHVAIQRKNDLGAKILIEKDDTNATIEHVDNNGKTPLYLAVEKKLFDVVKALFKKNADPFKVHNHKKPSDLWESQVSGPCRDLRQLLLKYEASWKPKVLKLSCDNISSTLSSPQSEEYRASASFGY